MTAHSQRPLDVFILLVALVSFSAFLLTSVAQSRTVHRQRAAQQRVQDERRLRGLHAALRDIRTGHVILRNTCVDPSLVGAWAEFGVSCPLVVFHICGTELPEARDPEGYAEYRRVVERHLRARFGNDIFQRVTEEAKRRRALLATQ